MQAATLFLAQQLQRGSRATRGLAFNQSGRGVLAQVATVASFALRACLCMQGLGEVVLSATWWAHKSGPGRGARLHWRQGGGGAPGQRTVSTLLLPVPKPSSCLHLP